MSLLKLHSMVAARQLLVLMQPPNNAGFVQIVRRHLHLNSVADGQPNKAFAHFAGNRRQDQMFVPQLDPKHGPRQNRMDDSFDFNVFFFHGAVNFGGRSQQVIPRRPGETWDVK